MIQIIEVSTKKYIREFLALPVDLYKNEPNWIRPLDTDIEEIFDPQRNPYFSHGECTRWILQNASGKTIGRVAAFIDRNLAYQQTQPTGGMGFFECINDTSAAQILFDTCQNWLQEKGMAAMDGPINFGDRDRWWGLLTEGFSEPNYGMFYHLPYYKNLFEGYGFKEYFQQYTFYRPIMKPLHESIRLRSERLRKNPDYRFEHMQMSRAEVYMEYFRQIYNRAWAKHGIAEMSAEQAQSLLRKLKPVMDERIIWFAYYKDEPVAFFVNIPELNQIFKHVNGKLDAVGILKVLWHKWRKTNHKMLGLVFGVVPELQGRGLEAAIIMATRDLVQESYRQYTEMEMNWVGDFNPTMIKVAQLLGAEISKVHITYRKLFDENQPFERHPVFH
jgi:hypothetical protein